MAYAINAHKEDGTEIVLLNVSNAVGPHHGAVDDVILVKALLKIALEWWNLEETFPEPSSGTLDAQTKENIKRFQAKFNSFAKTYGSPKRLTVDGRVSHARGIFSWDENHPWTIVMLNEIVDSSATLKGYESGPQMVVSLFPHLAGILKLYPQKL